MELVAVAHPVVEVQLLPVEGNCRRKKKKYVRITVKSITLLTIEKPRSVLTTYWGHEHLLEVEGLLVVGRNHLQEEEVHLQVVVVQNHHRLEEVGLVV